MRDQGMKKEQLLKTFTNRDMAVALFDHVRGRVPGEPWPLLPILTLIAPGGSGKSTLIDYLRITRCCLPDGRAALPYAYLDFTWPSVQKDLLWILVSLRNQLQKHEDGQGRHLTFPRFDLGATIAMAAPMNGNLPLLSQDEIQRSLSAGLPLFDQFDEMGNALGNIVPIIPPFLVGLKWFGKIPEVQELTLRLEKNSGWKWYRSRNTDLELPIDASISEVLLRLYDMSMPDNPGRQYLVEELLPAAFFADLHRVLDNSSAPHAWSNTANIVLFLDGFEALLNGSDAGYIGIRLLEMLTEHRRRGEADRLLLVIGSRRRLSQHQLLDLDTYHYPPFEEQTTERDKQSAQRFARRLYERWQERLPKDRSVLGLHHLYLPVWLQDFGLHDADSYLSKFSQEKSLQNFDDDRLITAIHRATYGHPLSLALAVAAVQQAEAEGRELNPEDFQQAFIPPGLVPGHQNERIGDYLLSLFLRELPKSEQNDLIFCAAPRSLDASTLRALLDLPTYNEALTRWERYQRLTFTRTIDKQRIVFHPLVRTLLQRRLAPEHIAESDYRQAHSRLKTYFAERSKLQTISEQEEDDQQPQVEEAYHALALGDPESAIIALILSAQHDNLTLWQPLLDAAAQAPTEPIRPKTKQRSAVMQRASDALDRAMRHLDLLDGITALVLYTWLLSASGQDRHETADIQYKLGDAGARHLFARGRSLKSAKRGRMVRAW
jgi:hypothetical protein